MDRLKEIFATIWLKLVSAIKAFEDSSLFERITRKYESLPPTKQQLVKILSSITLYALGACIILGPAFMLLSKVYGLKTLESLEADAISFQADYDAQTRGYTAPVGWKPFASSSANEIASSFNEYLLSIGVPEELGVITANGEELDLTLNDISIRQATNIVFQLEALYPKLTTKNLQMKIDKTGSDRIELTAAFIFNPAFANQFAGYGAPSGDGAAGGDFEDFSQDQQQRPPTNPIPINPSNSGSNGGPSNSDYNSEYIPPPPPPSGDYEEFTPPEIPDDIPPPPPPPGFEDE